MGLAAVVAQWTGSEFLGLNPLVLPEWADEEIEAWVFAVNFGFGAWVAVFVEWNVGEFVPWSSS